MGTNYYLREKPDCPCCGRPFERLHIGKSSVGWCFSLHVIPELGINGLADWQERWSAPMATIWNEYDDQISPAKMLSEITERSWSGSRNGYEAWFVFNRTEPGPNGLARSQLSRFCVGHGDDTYDLIAGEFS